MTGRMLLTSDLFPELAERMPKAVGRVVWRNANKVRAFAIQSMTTPKHGRLYRKSAITKGYKASAGRWRKWADTGAKARMEGNKVTVTVGYMTHRASAPGEAPAVDLGNLMGSIFAEMTGETTAMVGVNAEYGLPLEFGSRKIVKRPFMRPALDAIEPAFVADLRNLENDMR